MRKKNVVRTEGQAPLAVVFVEESRTHSVPLGPQPIRELVREDLRTPPLRFLDHLNDVQGQLVRATIDPSTMAVCRTLRLRGYARLPGPTRGRGSSVFGRPRSRDPEGRARSGLLPESSTTSGVARHRRSPGTFDGIPRWQMGCGAHMRRPRCADESPA